MINFLPPVEQRIAMVKAALENASVLIYGAELNAKAHAAMGITEGAQQYMQAANAFRKAYAEMEQELASLEKEQDATKGGEGDSA